MNVTETQGVLIEAISGALSRDADIQATWLSGSLGAGKGDAYSDVDVLVLTPTGQVAESVKRYANDLSAIAPTVLINTIAGRVVSAVTHDWQRFDLTFVEEAELGRFDRARLVALFNRSDHEPPMAASPVYQTKPDDLHRLVSEFFRVLGLKVVAVGREEYVLGLTRVDLLRQMTFDLMLEENGISLADRGGALHRNPLLTPEQRAAFAGLAPVAATRDGIIESSLALADIFLPRARQLAVRIGMTWPADLEAATRQHLLTHLDATFEI